MITFFQLVLCIVSQPASNAAAPTKPDTPASRYEAIVASSRKSRIFEGQPSNAKQQVSSSVNEELQKLIDWADECNERFTSEDYMALAEAAMALKKSLLATKYARQATKEAKDPMPYATLIHALCAASEMEEAEAAAAEAAAIFPKSERLYLAHNLIALKYRSLKQPERASGFMKTTIEEILEHVEDRPFYAGHLARCIDTQRDLAAKCGHQQELEQCLQVWASRFTQRLHMHLAKAAAGDEKLRLSQEELKAIGLNYQAAIEINNRMERGNSQNVCKEWLQALAKCERGPDLLDTWYIESKQALDCTVKALSPQLHFDEVQLLLSHLVEENASSPPSYAKYNETHRRYLAHMKATIAFLGQHERHQQALGASVDWNGLIDHALGQTDRPYVLIHLCDPFSPNLRLGVAHATRFNERSGDKIKRAVIAVQSGLSWDVGNKRFYRTTGQTPAQEEAAIAELGKQLGVPGMALLRRDREIFQLLKPEFYPINLLIDREGKIAGILSGPEREKVDRLVELANTKQQFGN